MWRATLFILLCIPQPYASGSLIKAVCSTSGYCYSLWQLNPPLSKWEANRHCQRHNHTLATIPNTGDQQTLARQLGSFSAWLGLNMVPTDSWKWLGVDGWYENTIPREDITDNENQACLIMNRRSIFGGSCSHSLEYLCEFKTKPPASTGCHLEPASVGNKYVCLRKDVLNWMSAARFCLSQQGNLLIINNAAELNQLKQTLLDWRTGSHFYIGGTRVILSWEEPGVRSNPYALKWSANVSSNPNLDEAVIKNSDSLCIYLSSYMKGLVYKKCTGKLPRVICSLRNQTAGEAVSPADKPVTAISYESNKGMVSEEKYMAAMVCAYVLAFLLLVVIVLFVGVFIWKKRRKRKMKIQDPLYSRKAYKSLSSTVTLRKERNTNPTAEWDKVRTEHEEHLLESEDASMNIIHNVQLDPRGSVEEPLTIPRDSQVVAVHREMSRDSHNSSSGDVATFSSNRAGSITSILKPPPPPLPPKSACDPNANDQPLPPPPPDLLVDSLENSSPSPPKCPPPLDTPTDPSGTLPPPPSKPSKRPPRRHKKREVAPDPIYAQIDKTTKRPPPPPISPKPNLRYLTNGSSRPSIDTAGPQDNSDSGVDMNVHSPATSYKVGESADQLELLDDVLNHLANA